MCDIVEPFEIGCGKFYVSQHVTCLVKRKFEVKFIEPLPNIQLSQSVIGKNGQVEIMAKEEKYQSKSDWTKKRDSKWLQDKKDSDKRLFFQRDKVEMIPLKISQEKVYDLNACVRYHSFERQDSIDGKSNLVNKRQRSEWWFKERLKTITGSKLVSVIGMFDYDSFLRTWYESYDDKHAVLQDMNHAKEQDRVDNEKTMECMEWGTNHEIDGLATLIHHLGDKYNLEFCETTLSNIHPSMQHFEIIKKTLKDHLNYEWKDGIDDEVFKNAFKSSPDASGKECISNEPFVVEIKCAYGIRSPKTYTEFPYYYYPQVQFHLLTNKKAEYAYFVSWSPTLTKIWRVDRDNQFWRITMPCLAYFHKLGMNNTPPASLINNKLNKEIKEYCKEQAENCIFIGEFDSIYSQHRSEELNTLQSIKYSCI